MDAQKLFALINGMAEYYEKTLSKMQIKFYVNGLREHDYSAVEQALMNHMNDPDSGQWMPKIADFKRALDGTKKSRTAVAWAKVDQAIRSAGPYSTVSFDDPVINRVIADMGGWMSLCETKTEKDLSFKSNEFGRIYEGYLFQGGPKEYPKKLTGIVDAENGESGEALLIGDAAKAKNCVEGGTNTARLQITRLSDVQDTVKDLKLIGGSV